jgi:uncharacterized lipoprotein YddW (UPF0748 family)
MFGFNALTGRNILLAVICLYVYTGLHGQNAMESGITNGVYSIGIPKAEIRAVWLTTLMGLDFPKTKVVSAFTRKQQQEELIVMLDRLQRSGINVIFFQTRMRGDVAYYSQIETFNPIFTGQVNGDPGYDPLAFVVKECHKRGMECHAWMVVYPVGTKKHVAAQGKTSVVRSHPGMCKYYNGEWYLDPGNPATRSYILSLINEVVRNYDIDGIHLDYIRYPDRPQRFPDADTYRKYGRGMNKDDWRRNNVTLLVSEIYDAVKAQKSWVQVSSSPVGKYRSLTYGKGDWTAYESVYQDAAYWMQAGKHDALYPMLYYKDADFYPFLQDWVQNSNNRLIVPGLGAYQMLSQERNWPAGDITQQIDYTRKNGIKGQAYFRAGMITSNVKGIEAILKEQYYTHPAKLPALSWLDNVAPNSPVDLEVFLNKKGKLCLRWQPDNKAEEQTYTIYCSSDENVAVDNSENILVTGFRTHQIELDMTYGEFGLYYSVTASDRFHNESVPCFPAYFVHRK